MRGVGLIALLALALLLCRAITEHGQRRIRSLDAMLSLIRQIKGMILCFGMPLGDIYRSLRSPALEACGFLGYLRECGSLSEALLAYGDELALPAELSGRLAELGDTLGRGGRAEAGELCDYYIGELSRAASDARESAPKQMKLYRSLVVTGMLMLAVVLI